MVFHDWRLDAWQNSMLVKRCFLQRGIHDLEVRQQVLSASFESRRKSTMWSSSSSGRGEFDIEDDQERASKSGRDTQPPLSHALLTPKILALHPSRSVFDINFAQSFRFPAFLTG